jgi:TolA-binding protein
MDNRLIGKYSPNSETNPTLASFSGPDPGPDRVFKGNSLFRGGRARAGLKGVGLGGGDTVDTLQRYFGIFLLCFVLGLMVAQHAESQGLAVIHQVRPGGIDQLLNPDSVYTTPDTDLFLQAAGRFQAGRWGEAIRILSEIIKAYPKSPHLERTYFLLAKSYDHMFKKNISEHFLEVNRHYQDAISRFPDSVFVPDAMVSIGNCYFKVKNYYEALAYYSLVCKNYKAYAAAPEALFEQGRVLALTKKSQEAIRSFQQVERLYPETPFANTAKIERAKALFDMNSFKRSLRVLDEIMTTEPNKVYEDPDILLYSGYNYYELGRLGKARDLLCKVLNYFPDIESNHLILTRIADTYREQGMESKALELYNMVIRRHPDSEGGLISMLRLAADIEKVELEMLVSPGVIEEIAPYNRPARETYEEIVKTHGDNPLSQLVGLRLALQQEKDNDHEGSINILRGILAKYPDTPLKEQIKSALGAPVEAIFEREQQGGNYAKIVGYYEEMKYDLVVEDMPKVLLILGDAYRRLHLYDRAISALEKAKKSYTDQGQPATLLLGLGESFYKVQRLEEAQRSLEVFVDRYPEDKRAYQAYFLIGDIMLRQKEYEQAIAAFDLAMQKNPDGLYKIDILLAMAEASNCHRDYDRASKLLNRAIALMNQNKADSAAGTYEAYQELGETYLKLGKNKQAVSAFENALKVSPKGRDDHSLQFRLAECYQGLEERDKTEGILNQIIASGDPFWSRVAEAKINEMNIREAVERLGYTWKTSQARIEKEDFCA